MSQLYVKIKLRGNSFKFLFLFLNIFRDREEAKYKHISMMTMKATYVEEPQLIRNHQVLNLRKRGF